MALSEASSPPRKRARVDTSVPAINQTGADVGSAASANALPTRVGSRFTIPTPEEIARLRERSDDTRALFDTWRKSSGLTAIAVGPPRKGSASHSIGGDASSSLPAAGLFPPQGSKEKEKKKEKEKRKGKEKENEKEKEKGEEKEEEGEEESETKERQDAHNIQIPPETDPWPKCGWKRFIYLDPKPKKNKKGGPPIQKDPADVLMCSPLYSQPGRVLASLMPQHRDGGTGYSFFVCRDRETLTRLVFHTPPGARHYSIIVEKGRPIHFYADLELELLPSFSGPCWTSWSTVCATTTGVLLPRPGGEVSPCSTPRPRQSTRFTSTPC